MRIGRRGSKSSRTYTPGTKTTTRTENPLMPGEYTTETSGTPSTSTVQNTPSRSGVDISIPHPGIAILLATGLFLMATWKDVASPFIDSAMNSKPYTGSSPKTILGGVLFIAIVGIISSTGPNGSSTMIWMLVAMWLLFIMFSGSKQVSSLFSSLAPNQQSTSSGTPTPNQTNTGTNTGTTTH